MIMSTLIRVLVWLAITVIALWAIDKLLLRAESRGWILYRRNKPRRGTLGNAFLEIHGLIEQGKKVIVQEAKKAKEDESFSGDPANPGRLDKNPTKDR